MKANLRSLLVVCTLSGCSPKPVTTDVGQLAMLQQTYDALHTRLENAAKKDPLVISAFEDPGSLVVAIRSNVIEDLAGTIAHRYLDHVTVDLQDVHAKSSGEVRKKTFLGQVKVGAWNVRVELGELVGQLRAGKPNVALRPPNRIALDIPVDVLETTGDATLHFTWDSSGIANAVCDDFELTRGIRGRVLPQKHVISGTMSLANSGARLTATPFFPDRKVELRLDLTKESWAIVEEALRSQDTASTCGTLMNPEQALGFLRQLAAKGVGVKLPQSIFRVVRLPASLREEVEVNRRLVRLSMQGESLRVQNRMLWSSASVSVQSGTSPGPVPNPSP